MTDPSPRCAIRTAICCLRLSCTPRACRSERKTEKDHEASGGHRPHFSPHSARVRGRLPLTNVSLVTLTHCTPRQVALNSYSHRYHARRRLNRRCSASALHPRLAEPLAAGLAEPGCLRCRSLILSVVPGRIGGYCLDQCYLRGPLRSASRADHRRPDRIAKTHRSRQDGKGSRVCVPPHDPDHDAVQRAWPVHLRGDHQDQGMLSLSVRVRFRSADAFSASPRALSAPLALLHAGLSFESGGWQASPSQTQRADLVSAFRFRPTIRSKRKKRFSKSMETKSPAACLGCRRPCSSRTTLPPAKTTSTNRLRLRTGARRRKSGKPAFATTKGPSSAVLKR